MDGDECPGKIWAQRGRPACENSRAVHVSPHNSGTVIDSERSSTRKGGHYSDVLPLKAARRDSISNLTFLELHIWAADEPNAVSFRVAVGGHVSAT